MKKEKSACKKNICEKKNPACQEKRSSEIKKCSLKAPKS